MFIFIIITGIFEHIPPPYLCFLLIILFFLLTFLFLDYIFFIYIYIYNLLFFFFTLFADLDAIDFLSNLNWLSFGYIFDYTFSYKVHSYSKFLSFFQHQKSLNMLSLSMEPPVNTWLLFQLSS